MDRINYTLFRDRPKNGISKQKCEKQNKTLNTTEIQGECILFPWSDLSVVVSKFCLQHDKWTITNGWATIAVQRKPCKNDRVDNSLRSGIFFVPKNSQSFWYGMMIVLNILFTDHFTFYSIASLFGAPEHLPLLALSVLNAFTSGKFHCWFSLELSLFIFWLPRSRCIHLIFVERVVLWANEFDTQTGRVDFAIPWEMGCNKTEYGVCVSKQPGNREKSAQ